MVTAPTFINRSGIAARHAGLGNERLREEMEAGQRRATGGALVPVVRTLIELCRRFVVTEHPVDRNGKWVVEAGRWCRPS